MYVYVSFYELRNLSSMRVSNRIIPPSEYGVGCRMYGVGRRV